MANMKLIVISESLRSDQILKAHTITEINHDKHIHVYFSLNVIIGFIYISHWKNIHEQSWAANLDYIDLL